MKPLFFVFAMSITLTLPIATKTAHAAGKKRLPDAELVQSIPTETNLGHPDLPHAKDAWVNMIAGAEHTIDMGQFYFSNAPQSDLEPVFQELEKAGQRGVKIRAIVDPGMMKNDPASYERFLKIPGAELRKYDIKALTSGIIHAKYFVIDGRLSFLGSQNFDWKALTHIHEMGVLVRDREIARKLTEIFNIDWEICATGKAPTPPTPVEVKPGAVELVASPPQFNPADVRPALAALHELFRGAKKSIQFQVMSYSDSGKNNGRWGGIQEELKAAAARGVKVEMLVSDWTTGAPGIDHIKEMARTPNVSVKIATIPRNSGACITFSRTMHSKMMVVDGKDTWVGTSNWSSGYFTNTRGVEMIFRDNGQLAKQASEVIRTLWDSEYSQPVDQGKSYVPPVRDCSDAR